MPGQRSPGREAPAAELRTRIRRGTVAIDQELLRIMVCPVARTPLVQVGDWLYSTDSETRLKYPIRDGIPIMLVEESQTVEVDEYERAMAEAAKGTEPEHRESR